MENKPWPSTDGPSIFLEDPAYRTWQYSLFRQAAKLEPLAAWDDFRILCDALGQKVVRGLCGGADEQEAAA